MRVMVVNQSAEMRQVLQYVLEQGVAVDIVGERTAVEGLAQQVDHLRPDWLFLLQDEYHRLSSVIQRLLKTNPDLRVILLTADGQHIRFQKDQAWQTEVDTWPECTLSEFIYMLKEVSPSPAAVKSIEDIGEPTPPKFVQEGSRS